jgi:large subunit ribosomal protein L25
MKTLEIIGNKRANLGKIDAKKLRAEGKVPCVLYGGKEQLHFETPMINFRKLVYTTDAHYVNINVEGQQARAILQDIQFHPVSEAIMHADFLELTAGKLISMEIPVRTKGSARGVAEGGKLYINHKYLLVKSLPKDMPEEIMIDITDLKLGGSIKVGELKVGEYEFLTSDLISVISVETPRTIREVEVEEEEDELGEGEEGAEGEGEGGTTEAGDGGEDPNPAKGDS